MDANTSSIETLGINIEEYYPRTRLNGSRKILSAVPRGTASLAFAAPWSYLDFLRNKCLPPNFIQA